MTNTKAQTKYFKLNPWMRYFFSAKNRCEQKNNSSYKNYGAKGIKFLLTKGE